VQIVFYFPLVSFPAAGGGFEANENKCCAAHGRDLSLFFTPGAISTIWAFLSIRRSPALQTSQFVSISGLQRDVVYLG
jgi:hypothetical protein